MFYRRADLLISHCSRRHVIIIVVSEYAVVVRPKPIDATASVFTRAFPGRKRVITAHATSGPQQVASDGRAANTPLHRR